MIKTYLLEKQNQLTPKESDFLDCGGPVPDFTQDRYDCILEMQAEQDHYNLQYLMDTMPSYY
jgi:hypothetical protein